MLSSVDLGDRARVSSSIEWELCVPLVAPYAGLSIYIYLYMYICLYMIPVQNSGDAWRVGGVCLNIEYMNVHAYHWIDKYILYTWTFIYIHEPTRQSSLYWRKRRRTPELRSLGAAIMSTQMSVSPVERPYQDGTCNVAVFGAAVRPAKLMKRQPTASPRSENEDNERPAWLPNKLVG